MKETRSFHFTRLCIKANKLKKAWSTLMSWVRWNMPTTKWSFQDSLQSEKNKRRNCEHGKTLSALKKIKKQKLHQSSKRESELQRNPALRVTVHWVYPTFSKVYGFPFLLIENTDPLSENKDVRHSEVETSAKSNRRR